MVINSTGVVTF